MPSGLASLASSPLLPSPTSPASLAPPSAPDASLVSLESLESLETLETLEPDDAGAEDIDSMTLAQVNDRQGELVDAVVAGFAEVAAAQARCAERVEALRRWSRDAAEAAARRRGLEHASGLDHGLAERSVTAELACALRLPERSASTLLVESQSLIREHPATMTALRSGEVSYRHALAVLDATIGLDKTSVLELDAILADRARGTTVSRLKRVARREREHRDPRPMTARHRLAAQDRHVELQPCEDGMAWLHHLLPAVQATAIFHRLTDIAAAVQGQDEPRTLAQLRADASIDLLLDDAIGIVSLGGRALQAPREPAGPGRPTVNLSASALPAPTPAGRVDPGTRLRAGTGTGRRARTGTTPRTRAQLCRSPPETTVDPLTRSRASPTASPSETSSPRSRSPSPS